MRALQQPVPFLFSLAIVTVLIFLPAFVHTSHAVDGPDDVAPAGQEDASATAAGDSANDGRLQLAAIRPVSSLLSSLVLAAAPRDAVEVETAVSRFASAEQLREQSDEVAAIVAYLRVLEDHPSSAQARAADGRANYLMNKLGPAQFEELEAALPAPSDLKSPESLTVLGEYHALRAKQPLSLHGVSSLVVSTVYHVENHVFSSASLNFPSSFYGPEALIRVAETRQKQGDTEAVLATYERVKREYHNRSASKDIDVRMDAFVSTQAASE